MTNPWFWFVLIVILLIVLVFVPVIRCETIIVSGGVENLETEFITFGKYISQNGCFVK